MRRSDREFRSKSAPRGRYSSSRALSTSIALFGVVALVTVVIAQPPGQNDRFKRENPSNSNDQRSTNRRPSIQGTGRGRAPNIRFLDTNRNGTVDKPEFVRFLSRMRQTPNQAQVADFLFRRLDSDGDGSLDTRELSKFGQLRQQRPEGNNRRRSNGPRQNPFPAFVSLLERNSSQVTTTTSTKTQTLSTEQTEFFKAKIRPVLEAKCYNCHSSAAPQLRGGLRVDMKHGLLTGGESGPAVIAGDPDESPLYLALIGDSYSQMPPNERLPDSVLDDFKYWIQNGAVDPRVDAMLFLQKQSQSEINIEEGREHWSFQPIRDVQTPRSSDDRWSQSDIDHFVWDAMTEVGLHPVADADRRTLIRRVTFDLIGLPPTPADIKAFVSDSQSIDQAIATVVDRLLDSPQFGERWGRHWLDVARYGESSGKDVNFSYPNAWRYRDYVVDAFNDDKPYDDFLREQIAGDLLRASNDAERAEHLIATGYLAVGTRSPNESDLKKFLLENADEQIDALSRGLLGLTIACARCHDHKFDPIRQSDYYALAGIFTSTETLFGGVRGPQVRQATEFVSLPTSLDFPDPAPLADDGYAILEERLEELRKERQELGPRNSQNQQANRRISIRISQAEARLAAYNEDGSSKHRAMGARDWQPSDLPILIRGDLDKPAEIAVRGFPEVLRGEHPPQIRRGSGRLELAEWLTDPDHPLTSRVMVNRIWQKLFGRGIVSTPDDFGTTGESPSHPELLDYLSQRFMDNDWSTKQLIRDIVLSRVYRLSADNRPQFAEIDPDNRWLWRHRPKRLEAEAIRDAMLFASGELRLNRPVGSAMARFEGVPTQFLQFVLAGQEQARASAMRLETELQNRGRRYGPGSNTTSRFSGRTNFGMLRQLRQYGINTSADTLFPEQNHRSIYLPVVRGQVNEALAAFDFPDPALVTGQRDTTTVATQALYTLNDTFVIQQSEKMAVRLGKHASTYDDGIDLAFEWTLGRQPNAREKKLAKDFFEDWGRESSNSRQAILGAWAAFSQSLFATAEFRQLD
ncbi:MAG TPA: DUF1553 domain-containing protein [Planctomycetaceae bacterium]|nr:DUF1553 domain-containing protein [Planctomycetaceae bacterium]